MGNPAGMIRVMASKDTPTLRRSIVVLSLYNLLIYLPLLVICILRFGQSFPHLEHSDEVVPRLALWATQDLPAGSLVGGLILAAPMGAVMSTVSSYLVVIASGLVRDVYQHFLRPVASQVEVRRAAHGVMIALGLVAVAANIHPVEYLQELLIVFSTSPPAVQHLLRAGLDAGLLAPRQPPPVCQHQTNFEGGTAAEDNQFLQARPDGCWRP